MSEKNFFISSHGMSVKDGYFASFTFNKDDWLEFRRVIRTGTGIRVPGTTPEQNINLNPSDRWSARWFGVDKVFSPLNLDGAYELKIDNFFNVRSWEEYITFISSSRRMTIQRPTKSILTGTTYNKVAEDNDEI